METPTYHVNQINRKSQLRVAEGHDLWDAANTIPELTSPWSDRRLHQVSFRALCDMRYLHFRFDVRDREVYLNDSHFGRKAIDSSDRVELFFRKAVDQYPYYCLEIDAEARVMDFRAYPNKKFDFDWNWPKDQLRIHSKRTVTGYTVYGYITLRSLMDLGVMTEGKIEAGVHNAKYILTHEGKRMPVWSTWVDPQTAEPEFHIKSSFGIFCLPQNRSLGTLRSG